MSRELPPTLYYGAIQDIQRLEKREHGFTYSMEQLTTMLGYASIEEYRDATAAWIEELQKAFGNVDFTFTYFDNPERHKLSDSHYVGEGRSGRDLWLLHILPPYSNTSHHTNSVDEIYNPQVPSLYFNGKLLTEPEFVPAGLLHRSGTIHKPAHTLVIMKDGFRVENGIYQKRTDLHFHPPLFTE